VARGCSGCRCTPGREIIFWGHNFWGQVVSVAQRARMHPLEGEESHFYWAEEGAEFN